MLESALYNGLCIIFGEKWGFMSITRQSFFLEKNASGHGNAALNRIESFCIDYFLKVRIVTIKMKKEWLNTMKIDYAFEKWQNFDGQDAMA